jgi:hypothetical protein
LHIFKFYPEFCSDNEGKEVGKKPVIAASEAPGVLDVSYLPPLADGEPYQVGLLKMKIEFLGAYSTDIFSKH